MNRRPKMVHVLEATTGGTRRFMKNLLKNLDKQKYDITFIYANRRNEFFADDLKLYENMGIRLIEIDMRRSISLFTDLHSFWILYKHFKKCRYDIIHLHSSKAGFLGRLAAKFAGATSIIYSPHAFAFQDKSIASCIYLILEKIAAHLCDLIICVSDGEKSIVLGNKIIPEEKIRVIPNEIDLNEVEPYLRESKLRLSMKSNDTIVCGLVGLFRRQKGHAFFLHVLSEMLKYNSSITFSLVGNGPEETEVKRKVTALDSGILISFDGYQEHIFDCYAKMDILISTSLWEGFPYSILEGMAMGLPVVATDVAGSRELILHNENGYLVQPGDVKAFASKVLLLADHPSLRCEFGKKSRKIIESRISIRQWAKAYEEIYDTITGEV